MSLSAQSARSWPDAGLGFTGMIAGVHTPIALMLPYLGLIVTFVLGYVIVSRGIIIESPASVTNAITTAMECIARYAPGLIGQSQHCGYALA
jgi:hypothetical protein